MMDDKAPFRQMANTIAEKQAWQAGRRLLYDGKHKATMRKITKDPRVSAHVQQTLDWPRIGVDYLVSDCTFDAFQNDEFGVTRLLVDCGGDEAILSAITNSAVGAVAFIAIIPRDDELPILVAFSGAEATGIKTARGDRLAYGLAVKERENGLVSSWYFFERGAIHVLDASGEIVDTVDLGVDAMPFVQFTYDPDSATEPYGRSRISSAAISSLDSALRNMGLSEQVSLINLLKGDLLLVNGQPDGLQARSEFEAAVGTLKLMFFDGLDLNGIRLEQLDQIELKEIESNIARGALNFASSMGMEPTAFGIQPTNGSFSEGTIDRMQKGYSQIKFKARNSYGAAIKLLAFELYKIVAQTEDLSGISNIKTVFMEDLRIDRIGAIGDAFQKMTSGLNSTTGETDGASGGLGVNLPEEYIRSYLGIPLRPEVINDELPNFEASRARFREVKIDGIGDQPALPIYPGI